jgi:hypothetical protein
VEGVETTTTVVAEKAVKAVVVAVPTLHYNHLLSLYRA